MNFVCYIFSYIPNSEEDVDFFQMEMACNFFDKSWKFMNDKHFQEE